MTTPAKTHRIFVGTVFVVVLLLAARLASAQARVIEVTADREAQGRFLFSATVELFEQYGFARRRQVGKHAWIVTKQVDPA